MIHHARAAKARRRYYAMCSCGWATPGGMSKSDAEAAARAHSDSAPGTEAGREGPEETSPRATEEAS